MSASNTGRFGTPPRERLMASRRPVTQPHDSLQRMNSRPFDFSDATALVIGGASGLGRAIAEGLASHGAHVAIAARQLDKARAVAGEIATQTGGTVRACSADLTSEASVAA